MVGIIYYSARFGSSLEIAVRHERHSGSRNRRYMVILDIVDDKIFDLLYCFDHERKFLKTRGGNRKYLANIL